MRVYSDTDTVLLNLYNNTIEVAMIATPSLQVSKLGHCEVKKHFDDLRGDKWLNWVSSQLDPGPNTLSHYPAERKFGAGAYYLCTGGNGRNRNQEWETNFKIIKFLTSWGREDVKKGKNIFLKWKFYQRILNFYGSVILLRI